MQPNTSFINLIKMFMQCDRHDTMHVVPFIFAMPNKATTNFAMSILRNNNSSSQIMQCMWRIHSTTTYICNYRISVYNTSPLRPSTSYNNITKAAELFFASPSHQQNTPHYHTYNHTSKMEILLPKYQATGVKMIIKRWKIFLVAKRNERRVKRTPESKVMIILIFQKLKQFARRDRSFARRIEIVAWPKVGSFAPNTRPATQPKRSLARRATSFARRINANGKILLRFPALLIPKPCAISAL